MFNKLKSRLLNYIKEKLGISELEHDMRVMQDDASHLRLLHDGLSKHINCLDSDLDIIKQTIQIGADIGRAEHHRNWAVICIHGKMDYVAFVDLAQGDVREVQHFLKRFEKSNRIIDAPLGMKEFIIRG